MSYTIDIDHCLSLLKEERILPEKYFKLNYKYFNKIKKISIQKKKIKIKRFKIIM